MVGHGVVQPVGVFKMRVGKPQLGGARVGTVTYLYDGNEIGSVGVYANEGVEKLTFGALFCRMLARFFCI